MSSISFIGIGGMAGTFGTAPAGDIVILAVPYASAALVTPDGTSGAQEIARAAPASAHVVKALNTVFGHVLAQGRPLDVLIAGDEPSDLQAIDSDHYGLPAPGTGEDVIKQVGDNISSWLATQE